MGAQTPAQLAGRIDQDQRNRSRQIYRNTVVKFRTAVCRIPQHYAERIIGVFPVEQNGITICQGYLIGYTSKVFTFYRDERMTGGLDIRNFIRTVACKYEEERTQYYIWHMDGKSLAFSGHYRFPEI